MCFQQFLVLQVRLEICSKYMPTVDYLQPTVHNLVPVVPVGHVMQKVYLKDGLNLKASGTMILDPQRRVYFKKLRALLPSNGALMLDRNVYYQPVKHNQAAVDSFVLVGGTLFLLQFTVSPSHKVVLSGLREIFELFPEAALADTRLVFVFCVPEYVFPQFELGDLNGTDEDKKMTDTQQVHGPVRRVEYYKALLPFSPLSAPDDSEHKVTH